MLRVLLHQDIHFLILKVDFNYVYYINSHNKGLCGTYVLYLTIHRLVATCLSF